MFQRLFARSVRKETLSISKTIRSMSYKTFSEVPNKTEFGVLDGTTTKAIVSNTSKAPALDWKLVKGIKVREELKDHEVMVQLSSAGICHTDITISQNEGPSPRILGHEGAGKILKVGSAVLDHKLGDPVLLSYSSCGECKPCKKDVPSFCKEFAALNLGDVDAEQTFTGPDGVKITGKFFGQSSFSHITIVDQKNIVNLKSMDLSEDDHNRFGPLGCGFMTGAGASVNAGELVPGESALIYGCGGVGALLIMGAKSKGAHPIIAADIDPKKLKTALEVGATHTVDVSDFELAKKEILEITNGDGVDVSVVCVGGVAPIENSISVAAQLGRVAMVGFGGFDDVFKVKSFEALMKGTKILGSVEGNTDSQVFLPKMIQWYKEGTFPVDKVETFYHIDDFQLLLDDMKSGKTTKAIICF